jgi:ketosteroid isomerase-like protein
MNRNDKLVKRFFDILENGGNWTEMYLIRDLLMEEYINGAFSQVEIVQIDDIIQEALERELEDNEPVIEMYYLDDIVTNIYKAIDRGDLDGAFALVNAYGENAQSNPYMYYCAVRELERVTGENYIELCL